MKKRVLHKAYTKLLMLQAKTARKLMQAADGESSVGDIATKTNINYVIVCGMLSKLRREKFLTSRRKGKLVCYSVNQKEVSRVMDICVKLK